MRGLPAPIDSALHTILVLNADSSGQKRLPALWREDLAFLHECCGDTARIGSLGNGSIGCALGSEVVEKASGVSSANTLNPHIRSTIVSFERIGKDRAGLFALRMLAAYSRRK